MRAVLSMDNTYSTFSVVNKGVKVYQRFVSFVYLFLHKYKVFECNKVTNSYLWCRCSHFVCLLLLLIYDLFINYNRFSPNFVISDQTIEVNVIDICFEASNNQSIRCLHCIEWNKRLNHLSPLLNDKYQSISYQLINSNLLVHLYRWLRVWAVTQSVVTIEELSRNSDISDNNDTIERNRCHSLAIRRITYRIMPSIVLQSLTISSF